jgi:hypothetical protein
MSVWAKRYKREAREAWLRADVIGRSFVTEVVVRVIVS